jgi:uncharacterized protein YeaO (DUF488 family)
LKSKKAIVILTNFWDANTLLDHGFVFYKLQGDNVIKINFIFNKNTPLNYSVYSIALSHPDFIKKNLPYVSNAFNGRLNFFCPTYNLLNKYHADKNWDYYTKEYIKIMKNRKSDIKKWIESLQSDHIYILCCWENTSREAHCHRDLIYEAIKRSKIAKDKILPIYRTGEKIILNKNEELMGNKIEKNYRWLYGNAQC